MDQPSTFVTLRQSVFSGQIMTRLSLSALEYLFSSLTRKRKKETSKTLKKKVDYVALQSL